MLRFCLDYSPVAQDRCGMIVCDTSGEKLIHTDGTGFVSFDIANRCPSSVFKGKVKGDIADEVFLNASFFLDNL